MWVVKNRSRAVVRDVGWRTPTPLHILGGNITFRRGHIERTTLTLSPLPPAGAPLENDPV